MVSPLKCRVLLFLLVSVLDLGAAASETDDASAYVLLKRVSIKSYVSMAHQYGNSQVTDYSAVDALFAPDYQAIRDGQVIVSSREELKEKLALAKEIYGSWSIWIGLVHECPVSKCHTIKCEWTSSDQKVVFSTVRLYSKDGKCIHKIVETTG